MADLPFNALYESGAAETEALFVRLASEDRQTVQQRPCPRVWSAEEFARHLVWVEDTLLRVENLGLVPHPFPPGFAVLPGQVLETHVEVSVTRQVAEAVRESVRQALDQLSPDLLEQTIEDSGGRTVAANLIRFLDLSSGVRAAARLVLRLAKG